LKINIPEDVVKSYRGKYSDHMENKGYNRSSFKPRP